MRKLTKINLDAETVITEENDRRKVRIEKDRKQLRRFIPVKLNYQEQEIVDKTFVVKEYVMLVFLNDYHLQYC
jgi:hypothetical protein